MVRKRIDELTRELAALREQLGEQADSTPCDPEDRDRLQRIVNASPMGIHMYRVEEDDRLVFVGANPAAERMLGDELRIQPGQTLEEAFPGVEETELPARYRAAARDGTPWQTQQLRYRDGEVIGAIDIYAFQTAPGEMVAIFLDVTEHRRDKVALERYRDQLEELVDQLTREYQIAQEELVRNARLVALGRLTASVAHELRNPLGVLQTAFFSLKDGLKSSDTQRVSRTIAIAERTINRVDRIIDELLDYTRTRVPKIEPVDLDDWLARVLAEQDLPAEVTLETELRCGCLVELDRLQMSSAVTNLIQNAVQAMVDPDTDIAAKRVTVTTRVVEAGVEIRVLDTGPGIPDDLRDRVLEPLFSTKSFGVGLGLPIVQQVMDTHRGQLSLHSVAGRGTTAVMRLPLRLPERPDADREIPRRRSRRTRREGASA